MSQYPGGQPPQDPYYGQQQGGDPYAPPPAQQPSDPYFGQQAGSDPYAQQSQQTQDAWQAQQQAEAQAQQQAWYAHAQAQQQAWQAQQEAAAGQGSRGGTGAAVVGIFLVLLGVWFLFREEIALDLGRVWPVLAVGLGIFMVIAAFIPRRAG